MRKLKIVFAVMLSAVISVTAIGLTGCSTKEAENYFTWWIPTGENSVYYEGYDDNPVVKYLTQQEWLDGRDIDLHFNVPATGDEVGNLSRAITGGTYNDIISTTNLSSIMSVTEMYEEGIALDLTDYVNEYMPNYKAFLAANPDLAKTATNIVDGEEKYLQIWAYQDEVQMWGGWNYRRDWILTYGTDSNPSATGDKKFTGGYGEDGVWTDNIHFPSWYNETTKAKYLAEVDPDWDGTDPVTISDWEWMLDIFDTALKTEGRTDGYAMQLYSAGYLEVGDLITSFGGGGATWYLDKSGKIEFGGTSEAFRSYLKCVEQWYKNGWIDTDFTSRSELFYEIDTQNIYAGNVGLWWGLNSNLDSLMRVEHEQGKENINVWSARNPVNDMDEYGGASTQFKTPYTMYQTGREMHSVVITDRAEGKDLELLFTFLDYLYSDEGSMLNMFGLTAEQYAAIDDDLLAKYNIEETGSYVEYQTDEGVKYGAPQKDDDGNDIMLAAGLVDAMRGSRLIGIQCNSKNIFHVSDVILHSMDEQIAFVNTGTLTNSFLGQLSPDNFAIYSELVGNIRSYCRRKVPLFVKGQASATNDADWSSFVNGVNATNRKYTPAEVTKSLNDLLEKFN